MRRRISRIPQTPTRGHDRKGAIVIIAMLVILLAVSITVTIVKSSVTEHKLLQREQHRLQSVWLADAGVERARAQLAGNPQYTGETWTLDAEDLGAGNGAEIVLAVVPDAADPARRRVTVTAVYTSPGPAPVRTEKTVLLPAGSAADATTD